MYSTTLFLLSKAILHLIKWVWPCGWSLCKVHVLTSLLLVSFSCSSVSRQQLVGVAGRWSHQKTSRRLPIFAFFSRVPKMGAVKIRRQRHVTSVPCNYRPPSLHSHRKKIPILNKLRHVPVIRKIIIKMYSRGMHGH